MPTNLDRLKSQLLTSGLQQKDQPLYQVIAQLIDAVRATEQTVTVISGSAGSGAAKNADYLTWSDQAVPLPNSRELLAGTNITFDDTIPNERTINGPATPPFIEWSVLTNGDVATPELIFAGGDVIMTHVP